MNAVVSSERARWNDTRPRRDDLISRCCTRNTEKSRRSSLTQQNPSTASILADLSPGQRKRTFPPAFAAGQVSVTASFSSLHSIQLPH